MVAFGCREWRMSAWGQTRSFWSGKSGIPPFPDVKVWPLLPLGSPVKAESFEFSAEQHGFLVGPNFQKSRLLKSNSAPKDDLETRY